MPCIFVDSPIGSIRIEYQKGPFLIARIRLPEYLGKVSEFSRDQQKGPRELNNTDIKAVCDMIRRYFEIGEPLDVPWRVIRLDAMTPLQRSVLRMTAGIPFGRLKTYGEIAADIGKPGASRFVGNTLAANPYPLVIPCHRVVRSDGSIGGFGGGGAMKEKLINHESRHIDTVLANQKSV